MIGLEDDEPTKVGPEAHSPPPRLRAPRPTFEERLERAETHLDAVEQETRGAALWRRQINVWCGEINAWRAEKDVRDERTEEAVLLGLARIADVLEVVKKIDERAAHAEREVRAVRDEASRGSKSDLEIADALKHVTVDMVKARGGLAVAGERDEVLDARARRNKRTALYYKIGIAALAVAVTAANAFIARGCHL